MFQKLPSLFVPAFPVGLNLSGRTSSRLQELRTIVRLAGPVVAMQLGTMTLGLVDMWMVGRLGHEALAATALGDLWFHSTTIVAFGILLGLDPLVSQAHGAGKGAEAGRALQRGLLLALLLGLPVGVLWLFTAPVLELAGQEPALAARAHDYVLVQLFSLAPFLLFIVLRQYLLGRAMMVWPLLVTVAANVINVALNELLIFGHWGLPALGVQGAGLATGLTRVSLLLMLAALVRGLHLHRDAWVPFSREVLRWRDLRRQLAIGLPVGLQMGLEMGAFTLTSIFAGWLGSRELAAHTIVIKLASFSFMVPLGISIATATRVGNLIGAGAPDRAQRAAWTGLLLGGCSMTVFAVAFLLFRRELPALFLPGREEVTLALAAAILPLAATFQVFDGTQTVGTAVLRGMGNARPAAVVVLLGLYLCALPLALGLTFRLPLECCPGPRLGLSGIWLGLVLGLGVMAGLLVLWVARHGPARAGRTVVIEAEQTSP